MMGKDDGDMFRIPLDFLIHELEMRCRKMAAKSLDKDMVRHGPGGHFSSSLQRKHDIKQHQPLLHLESSHCLNIGLSQNPLVSHGFRY